MLIGKPNPAQRKCGTEAGLNSKESKAADCFREQAFSAGLIDRRPAGVGHCHLETFQAGRNRRGDACGSCTDNQDIRKHPRRILPSLTI
jgi:hypothetical protein